MLVQNFPYIQTVVSGVLAFLLGFIWYHPAIMGRRWVEARGQPAQDMQRRSMYVVISFLLWMVASCFYSFLILIIGLHASMELICLSCLLWVAFCMPAAVMGASYTGYPFNAVAIDSAYQLGGYYIFAMVHIALAAILV